MPLSETIRAVGYVLKEANRIDLYAQVLELQEQMLQTQEERRKAIDEVGHARARVAELEEALRFKGKLEYGSNGYWSREVTKQDGWDGPFCVGCWDGKGRVHRMAKVDIGMAKCPVCKFDYNFVAPPVSG